MYPLQECVHAQRVHALEASANTVALLSKQARLKLSKETLSPTGRARTAKRRETKLSLAAVASPFFHTAFSALTHTLCAHSD